VSSASRVFPVCLQLEFPQLHPESRRRQAVPPVASSSQVRASVLSSPINKSCCVPAAACSSSGHRGDHRRHRESPQGLQSTSKKGTPSGQWSDQEDSAAVAIRTGHNKE
jgi:hypothetical protein